MSLTVVSIINHLPAEILAEIFSTPLSGSIKLPRWSIPSDTDVRTPGRWSLASVCQRWRIIIFSTPCLWSSFDISVEETPHPSLITALQLFFERSGNYPLTFALHAPKNAQRSTFQQVLTCFVKRARQWEDVSLNLPLNLLTECTYLRVPDFCFPRLRNLNVWRWTDENIPDEELRLPAFQLFPRAPLLSRVRLWGFRYLPLTLQPPWHQITYLSMDFIEGSVGWLLDILEHTPNLCVLEFDMFRPIEQLQPKTRGNRVLQLSHLQELTWFCKCMKDYSLFFNHISAPLLTHFTLECSLHARHGHWNAIRRFLQRSICSITHVKLASNFSEHLEPYLDLFPDCEQLELATISADSRLRGFGIFKELTIYKETSVMARVCPKLQRLVLHKMEIEEKEEAYSAFVKMVKSRLRGCGGLCGRGAAVKLEFLQIFIHPKCGSTPSSTMPNSYEILRGRLSTGELESVILKSYRIPRQNESTFI
ncbi:hypothetical protein NP233_g4490 [Leucocoprinus birnbaumii]|uniref:F-box domain-containing protein n=1 Tax=Leucocoprinus birnbaumii TaxID=56174 RepID=A0AAD5W108_9AGAR|nr:hypothetical protein NP233_g4490 [Leucocoprinus birnbaumii]